jgi:hypothetical protein
MSINANAQSSEIMFDVFGGKVWKHKKALLYDTPDISSGFQLGIYRSLKSDPYWTRKWNNPKIGLAYSFLSFGDKDVLGYAHSVFPNAYFNVLDKGNTQIQVSVGIGISFLNKTYENGTNETNNAIGSKINNISKIGFGLKQNFDTYAFRIGADFTHYSNGGTTSPNSGINVITTSFSISRKLGKLNTSKPEFKADTIQEHTFKRNGFNVQYHIGMTEDDVLNGPKYLVHALSLSYAHRFSPAYRLLAGIEYEYNYGKFHFELNAFQDRQTASTRAKQWIYIIAQEFQVVNFNLRTQVGIYSNKPVSNNNDPFYFKLISQYSFPLKSMPVVDSISLGVAMKSHYAKAEYIALVFNVNFGEF